MPRRWFQSVAVAFAYKQVSRHGCVSMAILAPFCTSLLPFSIRVMMSLVNTPLVTGAAGHYTEWIQRLVLVLWSTYYVT